MTVQRWNAAVLPVVRAGYGTALLLAPDALLRPATGRPADARARGVARVLGARHLVQAAAVGVRPTPAVVALGAEVDVAHAASMLGLAALVRSRRRTGLLDGAVAAAFAAGGVVSARRLAVSWAVPRPGGALGRLVGARDAVAGRLVRWCLPAPVRELVS